MPSLSGSPFSINVKSNVADFNRQLTALQQRQLPFATALALTRTAQDVLKAAQEAMRADFDRPTPYTLNSIALRPATKQRLFAEVFFREFAGKGIAGGKYLKPEVYSGARAAKRSELALRAAGIMRADEFWVPAKTLPLDSFGNIPAGLMSQILSQLRAQRDPSQNATAASRRRSRSRALYFVPQVGSALPRGVWERFGGKAIRPVLIFVRAPHYQARFPFYDIAPRVSREAFPANLRAAWIEAMATAR